MLILTGTVVVGQAGYYFILDLCLRVNSRPLSLEDFIESSRSLEPTTIKKELTPVPLFYSLNSRYSQVQILPGVFASTNKKQDIRKSETPATKKLTPKSQCMQTVLKSTTFRFCLIS